MFFLVYFPTDEPESNATIEELAADFADQILEQVSNREPEEGDEKEHAPEEIREELTRQIAAMMSSMRRQHSAEPRENVAKTRALSEARSFLERCYKASA